MFSTCDSSYIYHPPRRREVLELLEERINEEFFTREYKRDLLVTLLDSLA